MGYMEECLICDILMREEKLSHIFSECIESTELFFSHLQTLRLGGDGI